METRKRKSALAARPGARLTARSLFYFPFSILAPSILLGCASPGEPVDRKPPVARAVTDLAARQSGNDVILTFTLPKETAERRPLEETPAVEIYRDFEAPRNGETQIEAPQNPTLLVTIPAAMLDRYTERNRVRYADTLAPAELTEHRDSEVVYVVRTRASAKRASGNSNAASLRVYPAPDPIDDVKAEVTRGGAMLTWTPPQKDPTGAFPSVAGYHVYRSEVESGVAGTSHITDAVHAGAPLPTAAASRGDLRLKAPLARIAESSEAKFSDTQIEFGKTYAYSVRSVVTSGADTIESADSNLAVVTVRDTFPPAAPERVVVVPVPAQGETPPHLEISWAPSGEADIAGYNVYRSEQADAPGTRVNTELLLTPAFRDINVVSGRRYFYTVVAVGRSGNESAPSEAAAGDVLDEGQQTP